MSKLTAFNRFVNEDSNNIERLRKLGMAPPKPTEHRWADLRRAWNADPIIKQALTTINQETRKLGFKHLSGLTDEDVFISALQNENFDDVLVWDPVGDPFLIFGVKFVDTWLH